MADYFQEQQRIRSTSWMISYGDMFTLLLVFFIFIIVLMQEETGNVYRLVDGILVQTEMDLRHYIKKNDLENTISINRGTKGINVTIASGALYNTGKAEVRDNLKPLLTEIGTIIERTYFVDEIKDSILIQFLDMVKEAGGEIKMELRVEGHTDDIPINTPEFPSNWELSTQRALNVVKYIMSVTNLSENMFSATGYGEFRPIVPNDSEENRSKNRRVEIYIDAELEEMGRSGN